MALPKLSFTIVSPMPELINAYTELTGLPVEVTMLNSYVLANASAERGAAVDPEMALGNGYTELAQLLLSERIEIPRKQRRFLEFLYQPFLREGATA